MPVYRRAISYFTPDWPWIALLVGLIGVSVAVGILEAWPLAVLIDSVLTAEPKGDWVHRFFLSLVPNGKVGQVIGLVLIGMVLHLVGYLAWMARMMINYHLNYRGTTRVRYDWTVFTTKRWMNALAPLLEPAFRWNHHQVMAEGGRGLAKYLGVRLLANDAAPAR